MIARPKISRNERKTTEIGAFEVGNFALFSAPRATGARGSTRAGPGGRGAPRARAERPRRLTRPSRQVRLDETKTPEELAKRQTRRFSTLLHAALRRVRATIRRWRVRWASRRRLKARLEADDVERRAADKRRRVRSRSAVRALVFANAYAATPRALMLRQEYLDEPKQGERPLRHPEVLVVTRSALGAYELSRGLKASLRFARPWILRKVLAAVLRVRRRREAQRVSGKPPSLASRAASSAVVGLGVAVKTYVFVVVKSIPWVVALGCTKAGGIIGRYIYGRLAKALPGAIVRAPLKLPKILAKRAKKLGGRLDADGDGDVDVDDIFRLTVGKLRHAVPHRKHDD